MSYMSLVLQCIISQNSGLYQCLKSSLPSVWLMRDKKRTRKQNHVSIPKGLDLKTHVASRFRAFRHGHWLQHEMHEAKWQCKGAMDIKVTSQWLLLILECYLFHETRVALLTETQMSTQMLEGDKCLPRTKSS
jgi:hypothetical protein